MPPDAPPPRRLLVTGFEPYGGRAANASEALVRGLEQHGAAVEGVELRTVILPVVYGRVADAFARAVDFFRPQDVLCFGMQAQQRELVRIERVATNLDDSPAADNAGEVRTRRAIRPDGWAALRVTTPVGLLRDGLRAAGISTRTSNSAGAFLCNHLLYCALDRAESHRLGGRPAYRCGFFHVPPPEQAPAEELVRAAQVMIRSLVTERPRGPRRRRASRRPA